MLALSWPWGAALELPVPSLASCRPVILAPLACACPAPPGPPGGRQGPDLAWRWTGVYPSARSSLYGPLGGPGKGTAS